MAHRLHEESLKKGEETRKALVTKALKLFSKHGYNGVSFKMIADACSISQGAPRYHFHTKFGLFSAIIDKIVERRHGLVKNTENIEDNALDRLNKYLKGQLSWALIFTAEAEVYLLLFYFAATDKKFAKIYQELVDNDLNTIQGTLLAGKREGLFSFEEDSFEMARILHSYIVGEWIFLLSARNLKTDKKSLEQRIDIIVKKLMERQLNAN